MKKRVIQHKYNDWLPLKSEIGVMEKQFLTLKIMEENIKIEYFHNLHCLI